MNNLDLVTIQTQQETYAKVLIKQITREIDAVQYNKYYPPTQMIINPSDYRILMTYSDYRYQLQNTYHQYFMGLMVYRSYNNKLKINLQDSKIITTFVQNK